MHALEIFFSKPLTSNLCIHALCACSAAPLYCWLLDVWAENHPSEMTELRGFAVGVGSKPVRQPHSASPSTLSSAEQEDETVRPFVVAIRAFHRLLYLLSVSCWVNNHGEWRRLNATCSFVLDPALLLRLRDAPFVSLAMLCRSPLFLPQPVCDDLESGASSDTEHGSLALHLFECCGLTRLAALTASEPVVCLVQRLLAFSFSCVTVFGRPELERVLVQPLMERTDADLQEMEISVRSIVAQLPAHCGLQAGMTALAAVNGSLTGTESLSASPESMIAGMNLVMERMLSTVKLSLSNCAWQRCQRDLLSLTRQAEAQLHLHIVGSSPATLSTHRSSKSLRRCLHQSRVTLEVGWKPQLQQAAVSCKSTIESWWREEMLPFPGSVSELTNELGRFSRYSAGADPLTGAEPAPASLCYRLCKLALMYRAVLHSDLNLSRSLQDRSQTMATWLEQILMTLTLEDGGRLQQLLSSRPATWMHDAAKQAGVSALMIDLFNELNANMPRGSNDTALQGSAPLPASQLVDGCNSVKVEHATATGHAISDGSSSIAISHCRASQECITCKMESHNEQRHDEMEEDEARRHTSDPAGSDTLPPDASPARLSEAFAADTDMPQHASTAPRIDSANAADHGNISSPLAAPSAACDSPSFSLSASSSSLTSHLLPAELRQAHTLYSSSVRSGKPLTAPKLTAALVSSGMEHEQAASTVRALKAILDQQHAQRQQRQTDAQTPQPQQLEMTTPKQSHEPEPSQQPSQQLTVTSLSSTPPLLSPHRSAVDEHTRFIEHLRTSAQQAELEPAVLTWYLAQLDALRQPHNDLLFNATRRQQLFNQLNQLVLSTAHHPPQTQPQPQPRAAPQESQKPPSLTLDGLGMLASVSQQRPYSPVERVSNDAFWAIRNSPVPADRLSRQIKRLRSPTIRRRRVKSSATGPPLTSDDYSSEEDDDSASSTSADTTCTTPLERLSTALTVDTGALHRQSSAAFAALSKWSESVLTPLCSSPATLSPMHVRRYGFDRSPSLALSPIAVDVVCGDQRRSELHRSVDQLHLATDAAAAIAASLPSTRAATPTPTTGTVSVLSDGEQTSKRRRKLNVEEVSESAASLSTSLLSPTDSLLSSVTADSSASALVRVVTSSSPLLIDSASTSAVAHSPQRAVVKDDSKDEQSTRPLETLGESVQPNSGCTNFAGGWELLRKHARVFDDSVQVLFECRPCELVWGQVLELFSTASQSEADLDANADNISAGDVHDEQLTTTKSCKRAKGEDCNNNELLHYQQTRDQLAGLVAVVGAFTSARFSHSQLMRTERRIAEHWNELLDDVSTELAAWQKKAADTVRPYEVHVDALLQRIKKRVAESPSTIVAEMKQWVRDYERLASDLHKLLLELVDSGGPKARQPAVQSVLPHDAGRLLSTQLAVLKARSLSIAALAASNAWDAAAVLIADGGLLDETEKASADGSEWQALSKRCTKVAALVAVYTCAASMDTLQGQDATCKAKHEAIEQDRRNGDTQREPLISPLQSAFQRCSRRLWPSTHEPAPALAKYIAPQPVQQQSVTSATARDASLSPSPYLSRASTPMVYHNSPPPVFDSPRVTSSAPYRSYMSPRSESEDDMSSEWMRALMSH